MDVNELMEKFIQALSYFSDWFLFGRKKRGSIKADFIIFYIVCIVGVVFFLGVAFFILFSAFS